MDRANSDFLKLSMMQNYGWPDVDTAGEFSGHAGVRCGDMFGIDPFYIKIGDLLDFLKFYSVINFSCIIEYM